jgi:hypothetical protein
MTQSKRATTSAAALPLGYSLLDASPVVYRMRKRDKLVQDGFGNGDTSIGKSAARSFPDFTLWRNGIKDENGSNTVSSTREKLSMSGNVSDHLKTHFSGPAKRTLRQSGSV